MIDSLKRSDNPFFVCSENRSDKLLHRRCVFLILSFSRGLNSNACHCQEMEDKFDMIARLFYRRNFTVSKYTFFADAYWLVNVKSNNGLSRFSFGTSKVHFLSKGPRLPYKLSNL